MQILIYHSLIFNFIINSMNFSFFCNQFFFILRAFSYSFQCFGGNARVRPCHIWFRDFPSFLFVQRFHCWLSPYFLGSLLPPLFSFVFFNFSFVVLREIFLAFSFHQWKEHSRNTRAREVRKKKLALWNLTSSATHFDTTHNPLVPPCSWTRSNDLLDRSISFSSNAK